MRVFVIIVSLILSNIHSIQAQNLKDASTDTTTTRLYKLSINDLLKSNLTVASQKSTSFREIPGIISIVTEEEIKHSGARSLIDILRLVPGIGFAGEVDNAVGIGIRGNAAIDGKVLVLLDGQQMNETSYGSFAFGAHVPLDNIQKIEVIRGPGSAMYGGLAELAVINIVTKKGKHLEGIHLDNVYSYSKGNTMRYSTQLSAGKKWKNGLQANLSGYLGRANLSNETIMTTHGTTYNYEAFSQIRTGHLNLGLQYKDLNVNLIYDDIDADDTEYATRRLGKGLYAGAAYNLKLLNNQLTITPKVNWKQQHPWNYTPDAPPSFLLVNAINQRYTGNLTALYQPTDKLAVTLGGEYFHDQSIKEAPDNRFNSGERMISFQNIAAFAEVMFTSPIVNVTLGARTDYRKEFGNVFVPRLGITKVFKNFHTKLLLSRAFKAPLLENTDRNPAIKPEFTTVTELELGYKFSAEMMLTLNAYNIVMEQPIVYTYDPVANKASYDNFDNTGTRGIEAECRIRGKWGYTTLGYSFYQVNENKILYYAVTDNNQVKTAFPQHKLTSNTHFNIGKALSFNFSLLFFSKRYAHLYYDAAFTDLRVAPYKPTFLANAVISYNNLFIKNLNLSLGVYDIADVNYQFIVPYNQGINPVPDTGREFVLRLRYQFR